MKEGRIAEDWVNRDELGVLLSAGILKPERHKGPDALRSGMEYIVGLMLSFAVCGLATVIGMDRDRAFYPIVLMVIASYYVLFAVIDGSRSALGMEIVVAGGFLVVAVIAFLKHLWLSAAAIIGHGLVSSTLAKVLSSGFWPAARRAATW